MREPILKAVANPPKLLWGAYLPVLLNLGIQFPAMFSAIGAIAFFERKITITRIRSHRSAPSTAVIRIMRIIDWVSWLISKNA